MIKNYLKTAWRNFLKNKTFSFINVLGLAIGLCCFLLIALYVFDEMSYDKFYNNANRIYRIQSDLKFGGTENHFNTASDPMGAALKQDYPQVEEFTRIYTFAGSKLIKKDDQFINEQRVGHVDSTFFRVFQLPALSGNVDRALNDPNSVVITESTAKKYFGTVNVIGKTIETNDNGTTLYKVTAVIKDIPDNSHFNFDFLFSMDNVQYGWGNYMSHNFYTYVLLKDGTDYKAFEANFPQYINKYVLPAASQIMQINSYDDFVKAGNRLEYSLIPLTKIHLHSNRQFELGTNGSIQYVYIFSAVALFILLIACINFMNLATARSANRAKEVGIRKVLGTGRKNLVFQFLTESTLMAVFSLMLAVIAAVLLLDWFNALSGKSLTVNNVFSSRIIFIFLLLPVVVGVLAGSYPAFFLSGFRPIQVLKGKLNAGTKNSSIRSVLVVFQFATSIVLIISTLIVFQQLHYIRSKNLGFDKSQVLIVNNAFGLGNNVEAFKNEALKMTAVKSATVSGYLPVNTSGRNDNTFSKEPVVDPKNGFSMQTWSVDQDYLKTMGMQMAKGRNFSKEFGSDSTGVVINEAAAKQLGFDDPLGKKVYMIANMQTGAMRTYNILGVVKDFHFETMHQNITPLCFVLGSNTYSMSLKIDVSDAKTVIAQLEKNWKNMAGGNPFSYRFLDEAFNNMYRAETRMSKIVLVFSMLTILVACLGLFGLANFIAEQRTKEIGIRKVLGADVSKLVGMLSKDFMKLVLIAFVIAFPLAWWFMNLWLQDFVYRINIGWGVFVVAGLVTSMIALVTISFQTIRAALANPIKSLRTE